MKMWNPQEVDATKFVSDEQNLLPLLSEINPNAKIVISTIGSGVVQRKSKENSMKSKSLQSLTKLNMSFLVLVVAGICSLSVGCALMYYSVYDWILRDFLEMRSFSPMYPIWIDPPHLITFSVNIFEAVNPDEFLASNDPNVKLELRDVGPIVFREHMKNVNVTRHDNDTISFTVVRYPEFLEDHNEPGILNRTILVPNLGLIGALSFLHELSFFSKLAFNVMLNSADEPIFVNITVYDFLWNYRSDVISLAHKVIPSLVPVNNMGIMHQIYDNYADRVNVKIGKKNGFDKFFNMQQYNHQINVPGFDTRKGDCNATVIDSCEAVFFPRMMTNETVINYFRKSICQVIPLTYNKATELHGLKVFEYELLPKVLKRKENLTTDCTRGQEEILPDGLSDMSRCYYNFPMVLSLPHFYGFENGTWLKRLSGIEAVPEKHGSKIMVEPVLGLGVKQYARSQVNTYIRDLTGFPTIFERFSHMVIPLFWGEMRMDKPPPFTLWLMKFTVNTLPAIDHILSWLFICTGLLLWTLSMRISFRKKPLPKNNPPAGVKGTPS